MALKRTYGRAWHENGGWWLDVEPHVALRLKELFRSVPRTARSPFRIEGDAQTDADLAWFMERYPLDISLADLHHLHARKTLFEQGQAELTSILSGEWSPSGNAGFRDGESPYPYQAQAAELCRRKGRLLLMDDLGLGKTVSALATISDREYLPALIIANTHLVRQWAAKVYEFTTLTTHEIKSTRPYELPKADVYLCTYTKLAGWIDFAEQAPFKSIVFDEVQELRHGENTAKGRAALAFRQRALVALGLSATPIYNYGSEIFEIVNVLEPGALGSFDDFKREWCSMGPGNHWIVDEPQALGTYLRERHISLRRTDDDIGNQRPPLNVITHTVPFDDTVMQADDALIRTLARRVLNAETFHEKGKAAREFDMMLRKITGVAKAPHVAAFVRILLDAGQPVLLCGWHREVYEIWLRDLSRYRPVMFTGSETAAQKEKAKQAFCSGETNLFIMSLRSGAGLDGLQQRCRTIVFGELDWSPQVHAQCCGRLRRPGQTEQVDAIYLHADDGSDPTVISVLGLKASQSQGIVDPLSAPSDQHSDATRIQRLAELYLAGRSIEAAPVAAEPKEAPQPMFSFEDAL
ncbi:SNF2-related protein [Hyphomicrobium sp. CS1GBMeth3]|uniref:SNF2-related protein n=1 Tax=Hyphomicrobium sp. CS1GBMeth3 TaxID=1892845 RepID=UPI0009305DA0|nr:SNF2-related protein [Hyphomicrobium sp. CS1GBMeth3]